MKKYFKLFSFMVVALIILFSAGIVKADIISVNLFKKSDSTSVVPINNYAIGTTTNPVNIVANNLTVTGTSTGISVTAPTSTQITVDHTATSTYTNLQQFLNLTQSAGRIGGGGLTVTATGTYSVAAGTGFFRTADDDVSALKLADWSASSSISIATSTDVHIGVEYNNGSPRIITKAVDTWNLDTEFPLGEVHRDATGRTEAHSDAWWISDALTNIIQRLNSFFGINRDQKIDGLAIGETGTRKITVTSGKLWSNLNDYTVSAIDTNASSTFTLVYRDGVGGFTEVANQTQWPNTQYDDGDGTLATMGLNKYANLWLYEVIDGDLFVQYGQNEYNTVAAAQAGTPPASVPAVVESHGILLGRFIFQNNAASTTLIESAFTTQFSAAQATNHNQLAGLQGGTTNEYYHLTSAQASTVGKAINAPIQFIIESPTASEKDGIFIFNATSTINKITAVNKSAGDTVTFGLGYSSSMATATSSLNQLFSSAQTVTATTTPVTLTINASSTPNTGNVLQFWTTAASSTQFILTGYYSEN